jgi:hypothetical protein
MQAIEEDLFDDGDKVVTQHTRRETYQRAISCVRAFVKSRRANKSSEKEEQC